MTAVAGFFKSDPMGVYEMALHIENGFKRRRGHAIFGRFAGLSAMTSSASVTEPG
jgi:hypothetical protein